jgi:hypothetical protein
MVTMVSFISCVFYHNKSNALQVFKCARPAILFPEYATPSFTAGKALCFLAAFLVLVFLQASTKMPPPLESFLVPQQKQPPTGLDYQKSFSQGSNVLVDLTSWPHLLLAELSWSLVTPSSSLDRTLHIDGPGYGKGE